VKEVFRLTSLVPYSVKILQEEVSILGHKLDSGTVLFSSYTPLCWNGQPINIDLTNTPSALQVIPGLDGTSASISIAALVLEKIISSYKLSPATVEENPGLKFGLLAAPRSEIWIKLAKL